MFERICEHTLLLPLDHHFVALRWVAREATRFLAAEPLPEFHGERLVLFIGGDEAFSDFHEDGQHVDESWIIVILHLLLLRDLIVQEQELYQVILGVLAAESVLILYDPHHLGYVL